MNGRSASPSRTLLPGYSAQKKRTFMTRLSFAVAAATLFFCGASVAQNNAGAQQADRDIPFKMTQVATFELPWRIAFLPDGRTPITEKVGRVQLVTQQGGKTEVQGIPSVFYQKQN